MKVISAVLLYIFVVMSIHAQENAYVMKVGDTDYHVTTTISRDDTNGTQLVEKNDPVRKEAHQFILDSRGGTLSWKISADEKEVVFTREGSVVNVINKTRGVTNRKMVELDDTPWFAAIPEGLQQFVIEGGRKTEFWTVDPDKYKAYRMIANRKRTVSLDVQGVHEQAVHIQVSVSRVPAVFFSMSFWYRESDGVFLKYEGKAGGPSSPDVITELIYKEQ